MQTLRKLGLSANTGVPDFWEDASLNGGIYAAQDDYGTSYYFRGLVENNYVYFAGYYWRIIRINGNGSIRMIYDGTSAHANGESNTDRRLHNVNFNLTYNDAAYAGYMMGIDNQCSSGNCEGSIHTSSYEQATSNTYSSTIKIAVDEWYKTNIEDAGYSDKVEDVIYCNDRSIYIGNGYAENETRYGAYNRLDRNKLPVLECPQKNDAFTVVDTTNGNGALTYPVGLITADEALMAGAMNGSDSYLYTGFTYYTMTPFHFINSIVYNYTVTYGGVISGVYSIYNGSIGVRPVISLKSDVLLSGTGTMEDSFVVQ